MRAVGPATATLSVVIPCFNEALTLQSCVDSVLAIQDDSLRLQLIVVDDASSDGSHTIAQGIAAAHPNRARVEASSSPLACIPIERYGSIRVWSFGESRGRLSSC